MRVCHKCGTPWQSPKKQPGPKEFCEKCSAYLHCCLNCRYHDKSAHNECYIGTTDWVGDKAGPNFCDEFEFADSERKGADSERQSQARGALDSLFGDSQSPSDEDRLNGFKGLFGD